MGLTVYPTSAPRATVGGWLATDGLGAGSFRYGRLRETVLRARVVLPDGELREVAGWEVGDYVGPHAGAGIVVGARLRTRRADRDVPFAAAFADLEGLLGAAEALIEASAPLWHLGILNPPMAMVRGLGTDPLLFGAYPLVGSEEAERDLRTAVRWHGGRLLEAAEAYRVWGRGSTLWRPRGPRRRSSASSSPLMGCGRRSTPGRPPACRAPCPAPARPCCLPWTPRTSLASLPDPPVLPETAGPGYVHVIRP